MHIRSLLLYFLSKLSEIVYYSSLEMFGTLSLHQSGRTYISKTKGAASHAILETFRFFKIWQRKCGWAHDTSYRVVVFICMYRSAFCTCINMKVCRWVVLRMRVTVCGSIRYGLPSPQVKDHTFLAVL
jgi:hypothetical protein